jgi:hypothetical protein
MCGSAHLACGLGLRAAEICIGVWCVGDWPVLVSAPFRDDLLWQRDEKQVFELLRCFTYKLLYDRSSPHICYPVLAMSRILAAATIAPTHTNKPAPTFPHRRFSFQQRTAGTKNMTATPAQAPITSKHTERLGTKTAHTSAST